MKKHDQQSNSIDTLRRVIFLGDLDFFKGIQENGNCVLTALWERDIQARFVLINKSNPNELPETISWLKELFHEWSMAADRFQWLELGTTLIRKAYLINHLEGVVTLLDSDDDIIQEIRHHAEESKFTVSINLMAYSESGKLENVKIPLSIPIYRCFTKNGMKPPLVWAGWPRLFEKWIEVYKSQYPQDLQNMPKEWLPLYYKHRGTDYRVLRLIKDVQN